MTPPLEEFGATLPQPVRFGFRFLGGRFLRTYPYEEAFFLPFARQFLAALSSLPVILLGGITELETMRVRSGRGVRVRGHGPGTAARTRPAGAHAIGCGVDVVVHPLQQVHAHHLLGHALRVGEGTAEDRVVPGFPPWSCLPTDSAAGWSTQ